MFLLYIHKLILKGKMELSALKKEWFKEALLIGLKKKDANSFIASKINQLDPSYYEGVDGNDYERYSSLVNQAVKELYEFMKTVKKVRLKNPSKLLSCFNINKVLINLTRLNEVLGENSLPYAWNGKEVNIYRCNGGLVLFYNDFSNVVIFRTMKVKVVFRSFYRAKDNFLFKVESEVYSKILRALRDKRAVLASIYLVALGFPVGYLLNNPSYIAKKEYIVFENNNRKIYIQPNK